MFTNRIAPSNNSFGKFEVHVKMEMARALHCSHPVFGLLSVFGFRTFIDFYHPRLSFSFIVPLFIGVLGISLVLGVGEIKRHIEARKASRAPPTLWKISFFLSNFLIAFGAGLGAYLNPSSYTTFTSNLPYLAAGILVVFLTAFILLKTFSSRSIARMRNGHDPYAG